MRIIIRIPDMKESEEHFMLGKIKMPNDAKKFGEIAVNAFKHAKELPEKYGRLIDADALIERIKNLPKCPNGHSEMYDEAMIINIINNESTIIEAEKGEG
ncbi:MAG: hypothetical protein LIR46_07780 [Bacteroidota bacterium]|nr:hypothetical protein [Bacteroidota bacterium]